LRAALKTSLPEYMIPSAFLLLDALPLTPNGKVDRKALPAPEREGDALAYVAPRDEQEARLAGVFQDVLRVERVGVRDDFFALGGHSLLATQVVSRIRKDLGIEVALRELFDAPTVEGLTQKLHGRAAATGPALTRRSTTGPPRLSFAQERLWFLDKLEPGSAGYNMPGGLRLRGVLDRAALQKSLHEVVRRHEVLRTTFEENDGESVQRIHPHLAVDLDAVDLRDLPADVREARVDAVARDEAARPFDLARGPLLRAQLLQLAAADHVLLFTMHHIVSDAWSIGVLVGEVTALYAAYVDGSASPLEDLPIQYADYAAWQREWLQGETLDTQLAYWRTQLSEVPHVLDLPTDRPRPPVQTFRGSTLVRHLPADVKQRAVDLSRAHGATEFMTLLAAFAALLSRYTGQKELVVGSPIANRTRRETEGLIGFFVNTLALALRVDGDKSFDALLEDVKERTLGAYAHQEVPFEKLVETLKVERDMSRSPLFQVMFALRNAPTSELRLPGLNVDALRGQGDVAKFDLTLDIGAATEGYELLWEFNSDLFDETTVRALAEHFDRLLGAVLAQSGVALARQPMLSTLEEQALRDSWNATSTKYPRDACIHHLFERRVASTPDAIAVAQGALTWTYADLDQRAERVAAALHGAAVTPGSRVAVHVQRSPYAICALLGVMKIGAAYVPIDPSYPSDRISYMLRDSGARVVLFEGEPVGEIVSIDVRRAADSGLAARAPRQALASRSAAYVIYTSGSTGTPKGVVVEHRSAVNYLTAFGRQLDLAAQNLFVEQSNTALRELQLFAFETTFAIVNDKEEKGLGINPFEAEVRGCAENIISIL
jgi:acyl carrier protein